ncbi:MAG TPA: sulfite exporter TauE/SafE family protein [Hanamia sp.]
MLTAIIGTILFILVGATLSLLGGGGSILTVPVLVYVFGIEPHLATSYSMFLVGTGNWVAAIDSMKKKIVLYKQGLYFAIPGLIVTFMVRRFVLPYLPDYLVRTPHLAITRGNGIMLLFAVLMLVAAIKSLRGRNAPGDILPNHYNYKIIALQGLGVGLVTGLVGAGGGFLIIPALVFTSKVPMKNAVATSLMIIGITTTLGFLGDFNPSIHINWGFLLYYTAIALIGVLIANHYKDRFSNKFLRLAFGYLILVLSLFIFYTEGSKINFNLEAPQAMLHLLTK